MQLFWYIAPNKVKCSQRETSLFILKKGNFHKEINVHWRVGPNLQTFIVFVPGTYLTNRFISPIPSGAIARHMQ